MSQPKTSDAFVCHGCQRYIVKRPVGDKRVRYCSSRCRVFAWWRLQARTRACEAFTCQGCGKQVAKAAPTVAQRPGRRGVGDKRRRYCSIQCRRKARSAALPWVVRVDTEMVARFRKERDARGFAKARYGEEAVVIDRLARQDAESRVDTDGRSPRSLSA